MSHISEPFEIASNVTIIGKDLGGHLVSVTGYAEHYQFGGPMREDGEGGFITDDNTHLIYTFRDRPQLTLRWGDLVELVDHDEAA